MKGVVSAKVKSFVFLFLIQFCFNSFPEWVCLFQFGFYCLKMFHFTVVFIHFSGGHMSKVRFRKISIGVTVKTQLSEGS